MKKFIRFRTAGNILLAALVVLAVFDVLVLLRVAPSNIVWGGQIQGSQVNLLLFELVALVVTVLFALIVAARMGYIKAGKYKRWVNVGIWIIFIYMLLNTIGNLASGVSFENLIFAPITLVLALCALRLALE